ncbi:hypothetical protein ACFQH8_01405 [Halomicroarcula sp. GCM10025710]
MGRDPGRRHAGADTRRPVVAPPDVSLVETDYGVAVEGEEAL